MARFRWRRCLVCRASAAGWSAFGYDMVRHIETKLPSEASRNRRSPAFPTSCCCSPKSSRRRQPEEPASWTLIVYAIPRAGAWKQAPGAAEGTAKLRCAGGDPDGGRRNTAQKPSSAKRAFKAAVARAKQYIVDGDIMQVVISQRMSSLRGAGDGALPRAALAEPVALHVLFRLRRLSHVVGASPEILVRKEKDGREGHRCGRSPARASAAPRREDDPPKGCSPTRRKSPST